MNTCLGKFGMKQIVCWIALLAVAIGGGGASPSTVKGQTAIHESPTGTIETTTLSSDRQLLAVGGNRGLAVMDATTFEERWFSSRVSTTVRLAFSPDGAFLASLHYNGTIFLWDAQTGEQVSAVTQNSGDVALNSYLNLAFSSDGAYLAANPYVRLDLWTIDSQGQPGPGFSTVPRFNTGFTWAPSGSKLFAGGDVWDMSVMPPLPCFSLPPTHSLIDPLTTWTPDGSQLVSRAPNAETILWNIQEQTMAHAFAAEPGYTPTAIAFSPNGRQVALGFMETLVPEGQPPSRMTLWSLDMDQLEQQTVDSALMIYPIAFSPTGNLLASGSRDGIVTIWDTASLRVLGRFGNADLPATAYFMPRWISADKLLVTADYGSTLLVLDTTHFSIVQRLSPLAESRRTQGTKDVIENDWGDYGVWSSDNRFYMIMNSSLSPSYLVDTEQGRSAEIHGDYPLLSFGGWSDDHRYAVFYSSNQYGTHDSLVFDTHVWDVVLHYQGCMSFSMASCSAPSIESMLAQVGAVPAP